MTGYDRETSKAFGMPRSAIGPALIMLAEGRYPLKRRRGSKRETSRNSS